MEKFNLTPALTQMSLIWISLKKIPKLYPPWAAMFQLDEIQEQGIR